MGAPEDDRAVVLGRVRAALAGAPPESELPEPERPDEGRGDPSLWRRRLEDYGAVVTPADPDGIAAAVAAAAARHGAGCFAVAADLPGAWLPPELDAVPERDLDLAGLDAVDGALYGCAWAVAETGTIALDGGPGQGRRRLSLIPDLSVCVVFTAQVLADLPQLFAALATSPDRRPVTLISGPSATSDIELSRVEGVHGPRRLEVVLVS
ncbi:MAG: LUD domain-containing protein [Actinobacteria bacterium]|nr:LUD domain-containing protein [Actinomycetota bacterium]